MSEPDAATSAKVSRERALQDIEDIMALRKANGPFQRYWMRRLADIRAKTEEKFRTDDKLTKDQREETRQVLLAYDGLLKMMDSDEGACRRTLG